MSSVLPKNTIKETIHTHTHTHTHTQAHTTKEHKEILGNLEILDMSALTEVS